MIRHNISSKTEIIEQDEQNEISQIISVKNMPESVEKHEKLVLLNPDDYNSWNYLKSKFLGTKNELEMEKQLELTKQAIQINPKSYSAWFHRFLFYNKNIWFKEHKLCTFLLKFDPRNFHCWNYCLKNGFEIKLDLHNPTSMYFKEFREEWLYIDPDDEAVWRAYENSKKYSTIRKYKGRLEFIFNMAIKGELRINQRVIKIEQVTHRFILETEEEPKYLALNGNILVVSKEKMPNFVNKILELNPNCIFALKMKLVYTENIKEREEIIKRLEEIDFIRREYYKKEYTEKGYYELYKIRY